MLDCAEISELARVYRRSKARHAASPRASEVKRRLASAEATLRRAAEDLGALTQAELDLLDADHGEITQVLDTLDRWADRVAGGVAVLEDRGAHRSGNRRLAGVLHEPTPRYVLVDEIARLLHDRGIPLGGSRGGALHRSALAVLAAAGESDPERGLHHVIDGVLAASNNRRKSRAGSRVALAG
jgi:hypothetical protein